MTDPVCRSPCTRHCLARVGAGAGDLGWGWRLGLGMGVGAGVRARGWGADRRARGTLSVSRSAMHTARTWHAHGTHMARTRHAHGTPACLEDLSQRQHLLAHPRLPSHRRGVWRECGGASIGLVSFVERLGEDILSRDAAHVGVAEAGLERGALRLGQQRRVRLPVRLAHEAAQVARHTRAAAAAGLQRCAQQHVAVQILQHQDAPCLRRRRRRS